MKNYQHYEMGMLKLERDRLTYEISNWERTLADAKSFIIIKYLQFAIKQAKENIHAIDAELCYREHN